VCLRNAIVKFAAITVLVVCIGSHVSELLDTWDHTFQTGNDIESALVILALTLGATLALASAVILLVARTRCLAVPFTEVPVLQLIAELIFSIRPPPIVSLRI
jgi:hypothetical protein